MKIWEAASVVLEEEKAPLHVHEIYERILARNLYHFKAKKPLHVLRGEIRRHCENISFHLRTKTNILPELQMEDTHFLRM